VEDVAREEEVREGRAQRRIQAGWAEPQRGTRLPLPLVLVVRGKRKRAYHRVWQRE
jgi:hypothetical protein